MATSSDPPPPTSLVGLLFPLLFVAAAAHTSPQSSPAPTWDVKSLCLTAPFPDLCRQSTSLLSSSVTHDLTALVRAVVGLSLNSAKSATVHVTNSIGSKTERNCERSMADAVDVLGLAVKEVDRLGRRPAREQYGRCLATIRALVDTAVADAKSCLRELGEVPRSVLVSDTVNARVTRTMQLSSNALVFVDQLHRPPPQN